MQQEVREIALELNRVGGGRVPVLVNARLKRRDAGDVILITVFDATSRRQYERELLAARTEAESRAAAASALQHVKEAVVLLDDDGKVGVLNAAACRLFGVQADDVRGAAARLGRSGLAGSRRPHTRRPSRRARRLARAPAGAR